MVARSSKYLLTRTGALKSLTQPAYQFLVVEGDELYMLRRPIVSGVLIFVLVSSTAQAVTFNHVVTLGDSLLDDSGGERSPVAAEHVAQRLGVPVTKFAISGSTSDDLIAGGQHTQAAAQFGAGDLAMLWIGGNDFFQNTLGVTFGLYGFIDDLEANVDTALSTLRGAGMEVVVFNLPDLSNVPATDLISNFRKGTEQWNDRLDVLAAQHGATVVDTFTLFDELAADPEAFSLLGNTPILEDPPLFGDCQFCVFADPVHPSSFAQGFIANEAIESMNAAYDPTGVMPLDELSIIEIAALAEVYASDFDGDQIVTAADLSLWRSAYGTATADADGDGDSDGGDYLLWQAQMDGLGTVLAVTVPEPHSLALVATGLLLFFGRVRFNIGEHALSVSNS